MPKRGFKLIDNYDSKKEPPKKKIKAEEQKPEKINRGRRSSEKHNEKQEEEQIDEQKNKPEKAKRGRKSSEKAQEVKVGVKLGESSQELEEGHTIFSQITFPCSKSTIETLEKCVKYFQS